MKNNNSKSESSLRSFTTLAIVIASSLVLASCGGGDSAGSTTTDSLSADAPTASAQAVARGTVPTGWTGRVPIINTSGQIPFDKTKITNWKSGAVVENLVGFIENQYWVTSDTLDKYKLLSEIKKYSLLAPIAQRDAMGGYLIEIDTNNKNAVLQLNKLKEIPSIVLYRRSFQGANKSIAYSVPDDGSRFDNGGDNWHLEKIKITSAWNYSTGTQGQLIGVIDVGLYAHEDLNNKIAINYTTLEDAHGTAVASTLVGTTNNGIGVSGINWSAQVAFDGAYPDQESTANSYENLLSKQPSIRVLNNSWGYSLQQIIDGNPFIPTLNDAIDKTRPFVRMANKYNNVLHVWASGNDSRDAQFQNGALHYSASGMLSKLPNVIVVGDIFSSNILSDSSDYGETIDIVAPSGYKAASGPNVNQYYSGDAASYGISLRNCKINTQCPFGRSSSAAPIVSGVASLIFSINPNFTAAEVKDIIINSAAEKIKQKAFVDSNNMLVIENLSREIPVLNAEAAVKEAVRRKSLVACGSVSSPSIVGQLGPYYTATAGQKIQFTTTPAPKAGYPFGSYNWTTSDSSATLVNNGGTLADFVLNAAGTTTVTVTPVLADGTVCTSSAATAQVNVQAINQPTPSLSISMDAVSLAVLGATDRGYISYIPTATSGINKPAVSFLAGGNIVIPHNSKMEFTTGATFDLWARMDSLMGYTLDGFTIVNDGTYTAALLAKSGPYTGATFLTNAYGNASIRTMDSTWWAGGCQTPVYTNIPLNTWHRVTYTMSTTNGMQVYVNKKLVWSCQGSGQSFTVMNNNDLLIGGVLSAWGPYTTPGAIADIKIYKSALTAAQISQLN